LRFLLDTHLLLWFAEGSSQLPPEMRTLIEDPASEPMFSAASMWEVAIKHALKRDDFAVDARLIHRGLLSSDFDELDVTSAHAVGVQDLPPVHRDPFDRLLIAQARHEGVILFTADRQLATYGSPVKLV